MKYIRTKDKLIEISDEYIVKNGQAGLPFHGKLLQSIDGVIKQANNIYDLCDYGVTKIRFVELPDIKNLDEMNKKGELHNPPAKYIDNLKFLMLDKRVEYIKFAILTDKGLIFVAEMHENGDIELL